MRNRFIKELILPFFKLFNYKIRWRNQCIIPLSASIARQSEFEGMSQIHDRTVFSGKLGYGSYIGADCKISAEIGRFTSIASGVETLQSRHPYKFPYVSTSPVFCSLNINKLQCGDTFAKEQMFDENKYYSNEKKYGVKIGSDCWIGQRALIIGGVKIGDGAVVLANAVVSKDVPPYAIVGGVPAKILDYRYDETTVRKLLAIKWWNKDIEWIKTNWKLFNDIDSFLAVFQ